MRQNLLHAALMLIVLIGAGTALQLDFEEEPRSSSLWSDRTELWDDQSSKSEVVQAATSVLSGMCIASLLIPHYYD